MKIGQLKKIIENADDDNEVWMQVADNRKWVDCTASIDDNGRLAIEKIEEIREKNGTTHGDPLVILD